MSDDLPAECCARCHFLRIDAPSGGLECHRNPPSVVLIPGRVQGAINKHGLHPPTSVDGWCGEYLESASRKIARGEKGLQIESLEAVGAGQRPMGPGGTA